ncbi:hypothetical protein EON65_49380 [archaeon]|nr:MAG: hypothetical protein EON65_49380 [archaeon]
MALNDPSKTFDQELAALSQAIVAQKAEQARRKPTWRWNLHYSRVQTLSMLFIALHLMNSVYLM